MSLVSRHRGSAPAVALEIGPKHLWSVNMKERQMKIDFHSDPIFVLC